MGSSAAAAVWSRDAVTVLEQNNCKV